DRNRIRRGGSLRGKRRWPRMGHDHVGLRADEVRREIGKPLVSAFSPPELDDEVPALLVTKGTKAFAQRADASRVPGFGGRTQKADVRNALDGLLGEASMRRGKQRAGAEQELTTLQPGDARRHRPARPRRTARSFVDPTPIPREYGQCRATL